MLRTYSRKRPASPDDQFYVWKFYDIYHEIKEDPARDVKWATFFLQSTGSLFHRDELSTEEFQGYRDEIRGRLSERDNFLKTFIAICHLKSGESAPGDPIISRRVLEEIERHHGRLHDRYRNLEICLVGKSREDILEELDENKRMIHRLFNRLESDQEAVEEYKSKIRRRIREFHTLIGESPVSCPICLSPEKDLLAPNCGHVICSDCHAKVERCPTCRVEYKSLTRLYL